MINKSCSTCGRHNRKSSRCKFKNCFNFNCWHLSPKYILQLSNQSKWIKFDLQDKSTWPKPYIPLIGVTKYGYICMIDFMSWKYPDCPHWHYDGNFWSIDCFTHWQYPPELPTEYQNNLKEV